MGKTAKMPGALKPVGQKVRLLNLSNTPKFCAQTGKRLPFTGMVVEHDGKMFVDFAAAEAYVRGVVNSPS